MLNLRSAFVNRIRKHILTGLFIVLSGLLGQLVSVAQVKKFEGKKIEFLNADVMQFDNEIGNMMRLKGRVMMRHGDATMYADSAYRYMNKEEFVAFGQIHIEKGDSVHLYGDSLTYDGVSGLAVLKGRVRMIDNQVNLQTTSLVYDVKNNKGFYNDSAVTRSSQGNVLSSRNGTYYPDRDEFVFTENVRIDSPDYTVLSDTMHFNTLTEIAYFHGSTTITSDENIITCEKGWYDTKNDISSFSKGAKITTPDQQIEADSLYYERNNGFGLGFNNVKLRDSVQNIEVRGNYSVTRQNIESYMVTDSVTLIMGMESDSLFLSADSLFSTSDSLCGRILKAYHRVRFFKSDFQGKCDSLVYYESDSLMHLFDAPVLWSDENQMTSVFMQIFMRNKKIHYLDMMENAFIISMEDTVKYNQISGDNMQAYFGETSLRRVDVFKNGETIYYPRNDKPEEEPKSNPTAIPSPVLSANDSLNTVEQEAMHNKIEAKIEGRTEIPIVTDQSMQDVPLLDQTKAKLASPRHDLAPQASDSLPVTDSIPIISPTKREPKEFVGVNRVKCEDIIIHLDSGKVDRIVFKSKPVGHLSPFGEVDLNEYKLPGFKWQGYLRPLHVLDIYSPRLNPKYAYIPKKKEEKSKKKK